MTNIHTVLLLLRALSVPTGYFNAAGPLARFFFLFSPLRIYQESRHCISQLGTLRAFTFFFRRSLAPLDTQICRFCTKFFFFLYINIRFILTQLYGILLAS